MTAVPPRPAAPDTSCGCDADLVLPHPAHLPWPTLDTAPDSPAAADSGTPASPRRTVTDGTTDSVAIHRSAQQETNSAPDATAGDGLQSALIEQLRPAEPWPGAPSPERIISTVLALPALRDVLAAAARDAEKVRRCEAVAMDLERAAPRELVSARFVAMELRAALGPS